MGLDKNSEELISSQDHRSVTSEPNINFGRVALWVKALDTKLGLGTQPHYKAPGYSQVKQVSICSDERRVSEAVPSTFTQRWLWNSQVAVKKKEKMF